jgi:hypothetical protein
MVLSGQAFVAHDDQLDRSTPGCSAATGEGTTAKATGIRGTCCRDCRR